MPLFKALTICLTLALLASCSAPPIKLNPDEREAVFEDFARNQKKLVYWQMNGRFSFRVDNKVHSGNIYWVNNNKKYALKLSGPLDQSPVFVTYDGKLVTLKDSQGYEGTADTPGAMLARYTDYELPIDKLQYWLTLRPTPYSHPTMKLNEQGYPKELQEGDWSIVYQYLHDVDDYLLPEKIIITNTAMRLTLSIYDWKTSDKPYH